MTGVFERWPNLSAALDDLLTPRAITVVGASSNGYLTEHLLRNVRNPSCRFEGTINFVNPNYRRLFGYECVASVADLKAEIGVLFLLVPLEGCLAVLQALPSLPQGVILFADASETRAPGRWEDDIAQWGLEHSVPILGPQSNGLVSVAASCLGLVIPIVEDLRCGQVAVVAQSGGLLGGIVKYLGQHGIGLRCALEYGTGCMLSMETLSAWLLDRDDVKLVAIYADGVTSLPDFANVLRIAHEHSKTVVFLVGGDSEAGRRAAQSHSGMATTPRAILRGLAQQYRAISAATLDELVWSIDAIASVGFDRTRGGEVALFSDSGGANVCMADALDVVGVGLPQPLDAIPHPANREPSELAEIADGLSYNPVDFGSANMGQTATADRIVTLVGGDERFGVCAYASILGVPRHEQSVHLGQLGSFARTVAGLGKIPFIASVLPFLPEHTAIPPAIVAMGSTESAVKLRALRILHNADSFPAAERRETRGQTVDEGHDRSAVRDLPLTGPAAEARLHGLPVRWPSSLVVDSAAALPRDHSVRFPLVAKSEAGLTHRAKAGGVLSGISDELTLDSAVRYLLQRFGPPVSVTQMVPHDQEFFVGSYRDGDVLTLLFGLGGDEANRDAQVRLCPVSEEGIFRLIRSRAGTMWRPLAALLTTLQDWMLAHPNVESVDLNPVVLVGSDAVVLDAKIQYGAEATA